jgi:hypothetical protein
VPEPSLLAVPRQRVPERLWRYAPAAACLLAAVFLELTAFNLPFYNSLLAGPEIAVAPERIRMTDIDYQSDTGAFRPLSKNATIELTGFDEPVYTIYVQPAFRPGRDVQMIELKYDDMDATDRSGGTFKLVRDLDQNNYLSPAFLGDVRRIFLRFDSPEVNADITAIVLNRTVPLRFNGVRVILLSGCALGAYVFFRRRLWRVRRHTDSVVQKRVNTAVVAGLVLFAGSAVTLTTDLGPTFGDSVDAVMTTHSDRYSRLVDALQAGQVSLLEAPSQSLLDAERPYDINYRASHGVSYLWDYAFYDGKYYIYFGIVPVVTLFLPYKILTGDYLSARFATFLYGAAAAIFLYLFWSRFAARHFRHVPYVLYLLGFLTLYLSTQTLHLLWQPGDLEMPVAAAQAFAFAGLYFALRGAGEQRRQRQTAYFAAAAGGLALAVGCRPTFVFASALLLVFIVQALGARAPETAPGPAADGAGGRLARLSAAVRAHHRLLIATAIPYVVVAAGLMAYNYARFDSVFEFGASYQLTVGNAGVYTATSPLGTLTKAWYGVVAYLFNGYDVRAVFPFVAIDGSIDLTGFHGYLYTYRPLGLFGLPAMWALVLAPLAWRTLRRWRQRPAAWLVATAVPLGAVWLVVDTLMGGLHARYAADFLWLFGLAAVISLFTVNQLLERRRGLRGPTLAVCSGLLLATVVILTLVGVSAEFNWFEANHPYFYGRIVNLFKLW